MTASPIRFAWFGWLAIGLSFGCRTPEQYSQAADEETYALIEERRLALFSASDRFRLGEGQDSLRAKALRGELPTINDLGILDCLRIAADSSDDVLRQKESLYLNALSLTQERWRFGVVRDASAGGTISGTGSDSTSVSTDGSLTFSKILGSGANVVLGLGASLTRVVVDGDGWDAFSDLSLSITQPLLRAAGVKITMEPLTQAERSMVYAVRDYERFRRTFAVSVSRQVYGVLQALDRLKNQEQNLENLIQLRQRNARLAEAGQLSEIESDQAKQDELRSINSLVELRGNLDRQLDDFNLFLGLPINTEVTLDASEFDRLTDEVNVLDEIDAEQAVAIALQNRLDVRTSENRLEDSARALAIAADNLRPGLSLSLNLNSSSPEGRPLDYRRQDVGWSLGVSLDPAYDNLPERNSFRRAEISYGTALRGHERFLDRIELEVREAVRDVRNARERYQIQKGALTLAERRVRSTDLLLQAGRASTRDLLEARESLVGSANATTSALIELRLAQLDLQLALEVLRVDADGISMDAESLRLLPPPTESDGPAQ